ncbi:MAG: hypothetical protein KDD60_05785 [Bdellovibrionales bacterium]|nr:hypothetical protein [Bdellovibrionales bacterium]
MSSKWLSFQANSWSDQETGVWLDFSEVPEFETWKAGADELFQKGIAELKAIEAGEAVNSDEKRMVGHYWLRTPTLAPNAEIQECITRELQHIEEFAADVIAGRILSDSGKRFRHVVQIGIGGSALGPQLLADALSYPGQPLTFWSIDNTDPDGLWSIVNAIPSLEETLVLVVSKSGGTKETRNAMLLMQGAFRSEGISFAQNFVAVTGEGSELHDTAKQEGWRAVFPMWDWVGGRTSLWSSVGLLAAALQGFDIRQFLDGAKQADSFGRAERLSENPSAMLGLAWFHLAATKDMVVLPYKDRLLLLSRYLQQLVMESLGKEFDRDGKRVEQGLAVYGNKGSTDQHAYVQQLRDGLHNFFALFIEVQRDFSEPSSSEGAITVPREVFAEHVESEITAGDYLQGFLLGTRQALSEKGRASITITIPELSAYTLGMLIALFEKAVSFFAAYANINAYHQPGVEAGKKAASNVLTLQRAIFACMKENREPLSVESLVARLPKGGSDLPIHIFRILERKVEQGIVKRIDGKDRFSGLYELPS